MELNYLKEFMTVVKVGNIYDASDELFMSESTLQRHIKSIEDDLGQCMFEKRDRSLILSPAGEKFLPFAEKMIGLEREYRALMKNEKCNVMEEISIASGFSVYNSRIEKIITAFRRDYPEYKLNIFETETVPVFERFHRNECDFAFTLGEKGGPKSPELRYIEMGPEPLMVLLPPGHKLEGEKSVNLRQLAGEQFLLFGRQSGLYRRSIQACQRDGFIPRAVFTSYRFETLAYMSKKRMGVTLMPESEAVLYARQGLSCAKVLPETMFEGYFVYRRIFNMKTVHRKFLDMMLKYLEIPDRYF